MPLRDCGNECEVRARPAYAPNPTVSCGCARGYEDLTGRKFNRWEVLCRDGNSKSRETMWSCRCECGEMGRVPASSLRDGSSKSCGCLAGEQHGMSASPEYGIWVGMIQRCHNLFKRPSLSELRRSRDFGLRRLAGELWVIPAASLGRAPPKSIQLIAGTTTETTNPVMCAGRRRSFRRTTTQGSDNPHHARGSDQAPRRLGARERHRPLTSPRSTRKAEDADGGRLVEADRREAP